MPFEFLRGRPSTQPTSPPPSSADEDISGADAEIYVLLKRAYATHALLTVYVGPDKEPFTSAILEVVRDDRYLVLDELTPKAGHARLVADPRIELRALVDGIEMRCATRVLKVGVQDGLPYYKVEFPTEVSYAQRRRQHRVPVPLNQGYEVTFIFADEREVTGELRDLSAGGLCARIRNGDLDPKTDRNALAMCRIMMPEDKSIIADIEILHIDAPPRPRVPRLGGRFIDLAPTPARRIAQFCAELERAQRRLR